LVFIWRPTISKKLATKSATDLFAWINAVGGFHGIIPINLAASLFNRSASPDCFHFHCWRWLRPLWKTWLFATQNEITTLLYRGDFFTKKLAISATYLTIKKRP
jgi:hypothetical protein